MTRYRKGADAERELIHKLFNLGFSVVRTAGSGSTSLPAPDLIALSREKRLAFESKAWNAAYLNISNAQMEELQGWCERADAELYVAWKIPREGWLFLKPEHFVQTGKNYAITRKKALSSALSLSVIAGHQSKLGLSKPVQKAL
ncbi:MAG: Holliday junction resolvase Hjc [Candidatus Diapherotrites archaeon]|nr:Holliday junction resolvase [Candidatus Micrarchaeota archaeon]MBU1940096.1 Holliday junction resolvase [Candidatus Micrarchaeota archaeon]